MRRDPYEQSAPCRANDPITSQRAADSINLSASQVKVIRAARRAEIAAEYMPVDQGFTRDGLRDYLADDEMVSPSRCRTACKELVELGLMQITDMTVRTPAGREAQVLTLTERGWAA